MPSIEEIIAAEKAHLDQLLRAAFDAGRASMKADMLKALDADLPDKVDLDYRSASTHDRIRAPRGLARKMMQRVLNDNAIYGMTVAQIVDARATAYEKMLKASSIRSELRRGASEGLYIERNGKWFLHEVSSGTSSDKLDQQPTGGTSFVEFEQK